MHAVFAPRALRDLRAIGDFIAADSPGRASSFVAQLREACKSLAAWPDRYPILEECAGYRRMPVGNYLIFYCVTEETVRIVRVVHSAHDFRGLRLD